MPKFLINIFRGFALGTAEIIPGVSGGTIALIMGCYDELLGSISHFRENPKKSLMFLVPLLLGMGTALVLLSSAVKYLLEYFSLPTMLFFVGLICGIIPLLFAKVKVEGSKFKFTPKTAALSLVPIVVLVLMTILDISVISSTDYPAVIGDMELPLMLFILFAGVLAACALVVPGVSGSFVLLTLGLYPVIIYSVSSLTDAPSNISNAAFWLDICKVLLPFGIGVVIGGLSMVKLMGWLLEKHRIAVYAAVLGLLAGSVYAIISGPAIFHSGVTTPMVITGILTFAAGSALSFMLGRKKL